MKSLAHRILFLNTFAFTICFAAWMLNGVLVTYLVENQIVDWGPVEIGWLMGIPVLTGSLMRLPVGILSDRYGGKPVFSILLILSAIPMLLLSQMTEFLGFALCSVGFGLTGASFAVGVAYTSVWYPKKQQGTVLGIFGVGNAGAAITTLLAPALLNHLTLNGTDKEAWRILPMIYGVVLAVVALIFFVFAVNKKPENSQRSLRTSLKPLKNIRVWRFGLYYFLVFGCFVAFAQWLVPYFLNVYYLPLVTAGIFASLFSFPSGVIRALGGWLSDKFGARKVMYGVLGASSIISLLLVVPKMDIYSPGKGILASTGGTVSHVSDSLIAIGEKSYVLTQKANGLAEADKTAKILPVKEVWQEPVIREGEQVKKKQLIAKGVTHIFYQANVWGFAVLVILIGSVWGVGKAAVYKHIPDYFPNEVGVVGGMVGVMGGLGGFFCPIVFGYLLEFTGVWSSCWLFMFFLSILSLLWMHQVVLKMKNKDSIEKYHKLEEMPELAGATTFEG
ncbi:MFS transporter [Rapidithrix thailandica]|uniref:MFS transporter n=1 Tax=Rapidithrix thailandica TaxID=413964 RepID=A0AAW9S4I8_9BACT